MRQQIIFETARLYVRRPTSKDKDVNFYFQLWNDPRVMTNVGFPKGLMIRREDIIAQIARADETEYDKTLLIIDKETNESVGECKLGLADDEGIAHTDVKLIPEFWGKGYGIEIKQALVNYLFTHTDCTAIQASPNKENIASQKMQERVGGKRIKEGTYHFPEHMRSYTKDIELYIYRLTRSDWEERKKKKLGVLHD